MAAIDFHVFVCENMREPDDARGSCGDKGGTALRAVFKEELKKHGLGKVSRANKAGCLDVCKFGPAVVVYPEGIWYTVHSADDAREIVQEHFVNGRIVERLLIPTRKP